MVRKRKKRKKKARQPPSPLVIAQRKQKSQVRGLFKRAGFSRIKSDGIEFTFRDRTGEIDDLFVSENILILTEYTVSNSETEHFAKKKLLFDRIQQDPAGWISSFSELCEQLKEYVDGSGFSSSQFRIRILYCPRDVIATEISKICSDIYFFESNYRKYFFSLTKTIGKSARFEIYKYFGFGADEVGENIFSSATTAKRFTGHLLPEGFSDFPSNFKVVTFYADPKTLLERSFVLRADSWRDPEGLYQRMLVPSKIRAMRKYLDEKQRVFINNVIVSLPSTTNLNDAASAGSNLADKDLSRPKAVEIQIPDGYNKVGIIDGQHRIFCYHEGSDSLEPKIAKLRIRQNLLVTGIIYPLTLSEAKRKKFEATLFLEINAEQAKATSDLKHGIELILRPASNVAISKAVVQQLSEKGPLRGLLKSHFFDEKTKIKTASIVSYGLRPLVKFEGLDCLFTTWSNREKTKLSDAKRTDPPPELLAAYIEYCAEQINNFLIAAKINMDSSKWATRNENGLLTPTVINGFINCVRELVLNKKLSSVEIYKKKLNGLDKFMFNKYKSSQWKQLGADLGAKFFDI